MQQGANTDSVLPVIDLQPFLEAGCSTSPAHLRELCSQVAQCLRETSCLVLRDLRTSTSDNETFLSMMERYYGQPDEVKMVDVRPQFSYQVGATPAGVEVPRCLVDPACADRISQLPEGAKATLPTGPDLKWRFFWRLGNRPASTHFPELNAAPVAPEGFPEWPGVMDGWGGKMLAAVEAAMQLAAVGFGLQEDAFTSRMAGGPHLLAPTGADLAKNSALGTVFAGYHYDLNFCTIHGKSRFPGLSVWLADGRRVPVRIPPGCLLLQAGRQMEWLTGGHVQAGWHEVVVVPETQQALAAAQASGSSTWRVSSTVFAHIASDAVLEPLGRFAQGSACASHYPATLAGEQVRQELAAIRLGREGAAAEGGVSTGPADAQPLPQQCQQRGGEVEGSQAPAAAACVVAM